MNNYSRKFKQKLRVGEIVILFLMILLSSNSSYGMGRKDMGSHVLQFDGILELNSAILQTHVLLFARYWVSQESYAVSIVWVEPHVGSLNFSIYPVTTAVDSDEQRFRITNEVQTNNNSVFHKPLGKRGPFRYMFNDYPFPNIRFAETEALASRIYVNDLKDLSGQDDGTWQTIKVEKSRSKMAIDREVEKLKLRITDGRVNSLKLLDAEERPVKNVEYEYSTQKDRHLLSRQNVLLPERSLFVGFGGKGAILKIGDEERMYRKLGIVHHKGTRACAIDYEPKKIYGYSVHQN